MDAAEIIQGRFIKEGIKLFLNSGLDEVESRDKKKIIHFDIMGTKDSVAVDETPRIAAGRAPNVENLGLEAAGVEYDSRAGEEHVDHHLRTTNRHIYAWRRDICTN